MNKIFSVIDRFGRSILWVLEEMGRIVALFLAVLSWMVRPPLRLRLIVRQMEFVGVKSIFVVILTGAFTGMVLALQSYHGFRMFSAESLVGATVALSMTRELGPVLTAIMLIGRAGSSISAEIGIMRISEQIDALTAMGANPIHYLVVPRFLACLLLIPALTIMADFMGVVGAYFYSVDILGIDRHFYLYNSREFIGGYDLFVGIFKSLFFGAAIAMVSCHRGFNCTPGAEGVGRAATASFVISFVLILVIDLFLGILLDAIYYAIWPAGARLF